MAKKAKIEDTPEAEITKDNTQPQQEAPKEGKKIEVKARAKKKSDLAAPIIADLIMLAMGICMLAWPDGILHMISVVAGVIFVAYAMYNIIKYFRLEEKKNSDLPLLITGIAVAIAGGFLIFQSGFIEAFFSILIGIILTICGIMNLQDAMLIKSDNKAPLILSIITLVCGVLCLFGKMMPIHIMVIFVGVILVVYSISDIIQSGIVYKKK